MRGMLESSTFAGNAEKVLPFHQDNTAQVKMAVKNIRKCAQEVLQVSYKVLHFFIVIICA